MILPLLIATVLLQIGQAKSHQSTRILMVGLGPYGEKPELGLASLHGEHDCEAMAKAFTEFFKVDDSAIHPLLGAKATTAAIKDEFTNWLVKDAQKGDRMVFYYSGHGTVALDASGKPCSAIIPYDAERLPAVAPEKTGAFNPKKLVTRDFFNPLISDLEKSGKGSNITFIIDACSSGLLARGEAVEKGAPNPGVDLAKGGDSGLDMSDLTLGDSVLIGGASLGTSAYENSTQQQGNLTLALIRALADHALSDNAKDAESYQDLRDKVMVEMSDLCKTVPQVPVFAGDLTRPVFGFGKIQRDPYFLITHRLREDDPILNAGSIYGLTPGCTVVIQDPTKGPNAPGIAATLGEVTTYESELILPAGVDKKSLYGHRARVTDWTPDAAITLDVSEINNRPQKNAILAEISQTKTVSLKNSGAAVHLCAPGETPKGASALPHSPDAWYLVDQAGNQLLGGTRPATTPTEDLGQWLDATMRDFGRRKAVEKLKEPEPWVEVTMEIVPAHLTGKIVDTLSPLPDVSKDGNTCRTVTPNPEDGFAIRVRATLAKGVAATGTSEEKLAISPYIYVLDLLANGGVTPFWPKGATNNSQRQRLVPDGNWYYLSRAYDFADGKDPSQVAAWRFNNKTGLGMEYLKLIATDESIDIAPLLTVSKGGSRGGGHLSGILDAYRNGQLLTRGDPITPEPSKLAVDQVTFIIKKN